MTAPAMPSKIRNLPRSRAGYPVPWFVATIDGEADFRIIKPGAIERAVNERLCWICGQRRPRKNPDAFVIGPMCAVNRVSSEPPAHLECAIYAAMACPFLTNPKKRRREGGKPEEVVSPAGEMITRNPGVALVWASMRWKPVSDGRGGVLFDIGEPVSVRWFAEGRPATRDEVLASIESGLPLLREMAEADGPEAEALLGVMHSVALGLVPA